MNRAKMKASVTVHRKDVTSTSPEPWVQVGNARRALIRRLTDQQALTENTQWDLKATHEAILVKTDATQDDYQSDGSGSRVLRRESDGANFTIERVSKDWGRQQRGGRGQYIRLAIAFVDGKPFV